MAVFVDDMAARYGRMVMYHLIADSDEELHAMAARIGVARRWHQAPPAHDSHYDVCQAKRAQAVAAGAIEITQRQCAAMMARRRVTGALGRPEEALPWHREQATARRTARQ